MGAKALEHWDSYYRTNLPLIKRREGACTNLSGNSGLKQFIEPKSGIYNVRNIPFRTQLSVIHRVYFHLPRPRT